MKVSPGKVFLTHLSVWFALFNFKIIIFAEERLHFDESVFENLSEEEEDEKDRKKREQQEKKEQRKREKEEKKKAAGEKKKKTGLRQKSKLSRIKRKLDFCICKNKRCRPAVQLLHS